MVPEIPPLPALTAFELEKGQFDEIRLSWGEATNFRAGCLRLAATFFMIVILLPVPILVLMPLLQLEMSLSSLAFVAWAGTRDCTMAIQASKKRPVLDAIITASGLVTVIW